MSMTHIHVMALSALDRTHPNPWASNISARVTSIQQKHMERLDQI